MEDYIRISTLNDFIFCPKSIYYHSIYDENYNEAVYHSEKQRIGKLNHERIDTQKYSTSKHILQGIPVYNDEYGIAGKIDLFDRRESKLIERKTQIVKVYYGYKLQVWAQYFCMREMGFEVKTIVIHSLNDNQNYDIGLPTVEDELNLMHVLERYRAFRLDDKKFTQNTQKCLQCIYRELCDYYHQKDYTQLSLFERNIVKAKKKFKTKRKNYVELS